MDHYTYLIHQISTGSKDHPNELFTENDIKIYHSKVIEITGAKATRNDCYESNKYFIYISKWPTNHIAIDNKSGTTRLFSIYNISDFAKFEKRIKNSCHL